MNGNREIGKHFAQGSRVEIPFDAVDWQNRDAQSLQRRLAEHEHAIGGEGPLDFYRRHSRSVAQTPNPIARVRVNVNEALMPSEISRPARLAMLHEIFGRCAQ